LEKPTLRNENGDLLKRKLWQFGLRPIAKTIDKPPKPKAWRTTFLSQQIFHI